MVQTMPSFPAPLLSWIRQGLPRQQTVQEAMAELAASQPQVVPKVSGMPPVQPVNYTGPLAPLHVDEMPPGLLAGQAPYQPGIGDGNAGSQSGPSGFGFGPDPNAAMGLWRPAVNRPMGVAQDISRQSKTAWGLDPNIYATAQQYPNAALSAINAATPPPIPVSLSPFDLQRLRNNYVKQGVAQTMGAPTPSQQIWNRTGFAPPALGAIAGINFGSNKAWSTPGRPRQQVSTQVDTGGATVNGKPVTTGDAIRMMNGGIPWGMPYAGNASPWYRMATGMSPVQADRFADAPRGLSGFADNSMQDTQVQRDEQQRLKRLTGNY